MPSSQSAAVEQPPEGGTCLHTPASPSHESIVQRLPSSHSSVRVHGPWAWRLSATFSELGGPPALQEAISAAAEIETRLRAARRLNI